MVSSGDFGYTAANWPANLRSVTSVGGTELHRAANARGWSETTWNNDWGAGSSGCSAYVPKPSWQPATDCPMRTVADVSAAAFNIPVYNTVYGGWVTVAGTSASAPLIAGIYGLAGNGATTTQKFLYAHASSLFDITSGNNDWWDGGGRGRLRPRLPVRRRPRLRRPHRPRHPPRNRSLLRPGRRRTPPFVAAARAARAGGRGACGTAGAGARADRAGGRGACSMRGRNRYGVRRALRAAAVTRDPRAMQGQPAHAARTPAAAIKVQAPPIMCNTVCMTSGRIIIGRRVGT